MIKGRRVGTLTAGIILVIFGTILLLRTFMPAFNLSWIISLWPVVLIFLGIEIIASYVINKEEKMQYDFAAIMLVIILSFFAIGMGGAEFLIHHAHTYINY